MSDFLSKRPFLLRSFLIFFMALAYFSIFLLLANRSEVTAIQYYDAFFGLDDGYYFHTMYETKDNVWNNVTARHPLYPVLGHIITNLRELLTYIIPAFSLRINNYGYIVFLQCLLNSITVLYVYKYLINIVKLSKKITFLLTLFYAVGMGTIVFSIFVESFIISGFFLVWMIYYAQKSPEKKWVQITAGVALTGITITNGVIWAGNVIIQYLRNTRVLITICILTFCIFLSLLFTQNYGVLFITEGLQLVNNVSGDFIASLQGWDWIKAIFFHLVISPFFGLSIIQKDIFGDLQGIVFLAHSSPLVIIAGLIWLILLVYALFTVYKNKNTWILYFVLLFNFLLHGVKQFGIYEAFLYSQHHMFAQIFIIGYLCKKHEKIKWLPVLLIILLIISIISNIETLREMFSFAMRYAPRK